MSTAAAVKPSLTIKRRFNAPPEKVFAAWTDPEKVKRWMGPGEVKVLSAEGDARTGGRFRWRMQTPSGEDHDVSGVYREVEPPVRAVRTEVMSMGTCPSGGSGPAMGECLTSLILIERDGRTTVTTTMHFDSKEARDGALASGMERGVSAGYDKMEELLAASVRIVGQR